MKKLNLTALFALAAFFVLVASSQAASVLHWKLDESVGPNYQEEVYASNTQSVEVGVVNEGQAGLAPDGGTSIGFQRDTSDSYISAGTVLDNAGSPGTYVAGDNAAAYKLGNNYSFTGWFNAKTITNQDSSIASSVFDSNSGWLLGVRSGQVFFDFGNTRHTASSGIQVEKDYFVAVLADPNGDTNFGWSAGSNNRIAIYDPVADTWFDNDGTQFKNQLWTRNMSIGRFTNGGRQFDGLIDDFRIYNHTLSFDELTALVTLPASVPEPATALLVGLGLIGLVMRRRRK
jgi:hypothetical protein